MRMKRLPLFAMIAFLGLMGSSRALTQRQDELREEFHQTFTLTPNGRVSLENINGGVKVTGWDRNEVKVDAVKRAYTKERLDETRIDVNADQDSVHIRTQYPERSSHFSKDKDSGHDSFATVEYVLTIPRNARVDSIELINGPLNISSLNGEVKASLINGTLTAAGLAGDVKLSTVNGGVDAAFDRLTGARQISLSSVNGSLTLTIPSDSNAQLRADTVHGGISNDFNLPVKRGEYVGRNLYGRLGQGGPDIRLSNVNGSISIKHASDNRPLSNATSLLQSGDSDDAAPDQDDIARETARAVRDAVREAERIQREAHGSTLEAQRESLREARKIEKEAARIQRDALRESERAIQESRLINEHMSGARGGYTNSYRLVEQDTKSFPVNGTPRISIETFDGSVMIRSWDKNEVTLSITKRAADETSLRRTRLEANQAGNNITIRADYDRAYPNAPDSGPRALVNLEVFVPRRSDITANSGDGSLSLEGVNGDVDLHTGDGSVSVTGARGRLNVLTGDGGVRVDGFDGNAAVKTGDGRIALQGKFGQLAAKTGDGSIVLELVPGHNATIETRAEDVVNDGVATEETSGAGHARRWRVGSGGAVFTLHTGDGRIYLKGAGSPTIPR
jgi:DUF4097 and DUF4098 domain-containing protein YvlB